MKRLSVYLTLLAMLLMVGCDKPVSLPPGSFYVGDGVESNRLTLKGLADSSNMFYISSKYPWSIEECPGLRCEPSSGNAGENICITATALRTNNSLELQELGALNFRVENTRFVGITAWQESAVTVGREFSSKLYLDAEQGAKHTLRMTSKLFGNELDITSQGDIEVVATQDGEFKFEVTITALADNHSAEERKIGDFSLNLDGDYTNTTIEVWQRPALVVDAKSVLLSGKAGVHSTLLVTSPFDTEAKSSSAEFTVEKSAKGVFVVVAKSENGGDVRRRLGTIDISLTSAPSEVVRSVEVWQRPAAAPQTILCYCMGTALGSYYRTNIAMMKRALEQNVQGESRVVIFTQSNSLRGKVIELVYEPSDGSVSEVELVPNINLPATYDAQMLASILSQMVAVAPAHHYSLIVGSHGKAWIPKASTLAATTYGVPHHDIWQQVEGALPTRHMGDAVATQLNVSEFAEACAAVGQQLDYILFDQCFASNVEMLYELRNLTKYVVASPCEVMASGFPYAEVMPLLLEDGGTGYNLDAVAKAYVDYYLEKMTGNSVSACVAVTTCSEMDALAEAVKRVNAAAVREDFDLANVQAYEGISVIKNPTHIFYDLEDFAMQSCADEAAVTALREQLDKMVLSRYHTPKFYSAYNGKANDITHYCGITTSAPITFDSKSAYIDEWQQTQWYKATH